MSAFGQVAASPRDLDRFTSGSLEAELRRRGFRQHTPIGDATAQRLRKELAWRMDCNGPLDVDQTSLRAAEDCFRRGQVDDALHHLERALPSGFSGLSAAAVPRSRSPEARP